MVNNSDTKVRYRGNGSNRVFPITFPFTENDYVFVRIANEETGEVTELTSDYLVDNVANTVTYPGWITGQEPPVAEQPAVLTSNETITIYRKTEVNQLTELGTKFPLPQIEQALDKVTNILQEHEEALVRSVKVDISSTEEAGYYYEQMMIAANNALSSASAAAASQTAAAASQTAAAASAATASEAATAAAASASSMEESVATATSKAAEAAASATNAATSATNAATSASAASTSATNAATSASAASTSATNAATSATASATSATNAAGSAATAAEKAAEVIHIVGGKFGYRQEETTYNVGDMAFFTWTMNTMYIECTTGGTTGSGDLIINNPLVGDTVQDGTVVWTVRQFSSASSASSTREGITKIYGTTGNNTDGTMTQAAITSAINNVVPGNASSSTAGVAKLYSTTGANIDGAMTQSAVTNEINSRIAATYKAAGNKTSTELVPGLLIEANLGKVYNVTTEIETTTDFFEGAGKTYPAGTNVVVAEYAEGVYKFDVLPGMIPPMTGATASNAGTSGLVPAPASGDNGKFLRGDGIWTAVSGGNDWSRKPSTTYVAGDIAYSPLLSSWQRLECVTGGTTSSGDLPVGNSTTGG